MVAEIARTHKSTTLDTLVGTATTGFSVIPVHLHPNPKLAPIVRELVQLVTSCPIASSSTSSHDRQFIPTS